MTISEFWNSIVLVNFKASLVITPSHSFPPLPPVKTPPPILSPHSHLWWPPSHSFSSLPPASAIMTHCVRKSISDHLLTDLLRPLIDFGERCEYQFINCHLYNEWPSLKQLLLYWFPNVFISLYFLDNAVLNSRIKLFIPYFSPQCSEFTNFLSWFRSLSFQTWLPKRSRPELFCKKVFSKILQISQEDTCARVSW